MRIVKIATVFALATAGLGIATGTASADRGVSGCVAWSYDEQDDNATTTVYYHNRCNRPVTITVRTRGNPTVCSDWSKNLTADEKDSETFVCAPREVIGSD
ncbi:hypothetical protein CRH09_15095 [Nocardia terpenica]|uniref:Uncharacterized protein n=2 Tax=Nocardia terpenica TaxID=455432 RepID=A0A291RIW7_9NOCA|nr:hypothetical protein CRH09_15095 [Nocardia terpenica]